MIKVFVFPLNGGAMRKLFFNNDNTREDYLKSSSYFGLLMNLILFTSKISIGLISGSIAILSDGFNNLLDFSNSIITLVSTHLSSKPADENHPYGHGRVEYIATQFVSFFILYIGISLLIESIDLIFNPKPIDLSIWLYAVLILSFILKGLMVLYNMRIKKKVDSDLIDAVIMDSKADVISSLILLVAMLLQPYSHYPIDGFAGLVLSVILILQGVGLLMRTLSKLMGKKLNDETIERIDQIINSHPTILGYHNLKGHDYGPNHIHASVDIELADTTGLSEAHLIVDEIEKKLREELMIDAVCHIDPISSDPQVNKEMFEVVLALGHDLFTKEDISKFSCVKGHLRTSVFINFSFEDRSHFELIKSRLLSRAEKECPSLSFHVILD